MDKRKMRKLAKEIKLILSSNSTELYTLLAGLGLLFIPVWQRDYKWEWARALQLLKDIVNWSVDKEVGFYQRYFLTFAVTSKLKDNTTQIADGQQRLTSFLLLALAMKNIVLKMKKEGIKLYNADGEYYDIDALIEKLDKLIYYKDYRGITRLKIETNTDDMVVLEKVVAMKNEEVDIPKIKAAMDPSYAKECRVISNYVGYKKALLDYIKAGYNITEIAEAIFNCEILQIECLAENAIMVYIDMNSKCQMLSYSDMINAEIYETFNAVAVEKQKKLYSERRYPIIKNVGRSNEEDFGINSFTIIAMEDLAGNAMVWSPKNLYENFKAYFAQANRANGKSLENAKNINDRQKKYATLYNKYMRFDNKKFVYDKASELKKRLFELQILFHSVTNDSIVMYLLKQYEDKKISEVSLIRCLRFMRNAQARARYIGQYKGQQRGPAVEILGKIMNGMNAGHGKSIELDLYMAYKNNSGTQGIPTDDEVIKYFTSDKLGRKFANSANVLSNRFYFYEMNKLYMKAHKIIRKMPGFNVDELIVEHIVPPKKRDVWAKDNVGLEKEVETVVENVGNMALTLDKTNNLRFEEKAKIYINQPLPMTRGIGEMKEFKVHHIQERNLLYAKMFNIIFDMPKDYDNLKPQKV